VIKFRERVDNKDGTVSDNDIRSSALYNSEGVSFHVPNRGDIVVINNREYMIIHRQWIFSDIKGRIDEAVCYVQPVVELTKADMEVTRRLIEATEGQAAH
jgi:hypothetical protein